MVSNKKNCINEYDIGKTRCRIPKYHEKRPRSGNVESAGYTMGQNTKWRLSCQDGGRIQNGAKLSRWPPCRPAKVRDTNCHHIIQYQTMVEHPNIIAN